MRSLLFISLILLAYSGSLFGGPIWDDYFYLFDSTYFSRAGTFSYFWWMSNFVHRVSFSMFGEHFTLYHLLNISLHFLNIHLFEKFQKAVFKKTNLLMTLLFLLHPLCVQGVAWMNQSKTLLAMTFLLGSLIYFYKEEEKHRILKVYLLLVLSFFTKTIGIGLPIFFLLVDFLKKRGEKTILFHVLMILLSFQVGIIFMNSSANKIRTDSARVSKKSNLGDIDSMKTVVRSFDRPSDVENFQFDQTLDIYSRDFPIKNRAVLMAENLKFYLTKFFLPMRLGLIYAKPSINYKRSYFYVILVCLLLFGLLLKFGFLESKKSEQAVQLLFLSFVLWLPVSGLISAPFMYITYTSDRHFYAVIPFLLSALYLLWSAIHISYRKKYLISRFGMTLISFILLFYGWESLQNARAWKSQKALVEKSLKVNPESPYLYFILGKYYLREGEFYHAEKKFDKAIALNQKHFTRDDEFLRVVRHFKQMATNQIKIEGPKSSP